MLEARSVAVVGASERPDSFGRQIVTGLLSSGFEGELFPVNPRYDTMFGRRCLRSLEELPREVDLVALGVPNSALERELEAAAAVGARAAVIFASCYEAPAPGVPPLTERLRRIADGAEIAVCGGNCMGFLNLSQGLTVCGFAMPEDLDSGPITFISHSGSAFSAMAYNDRGLRFDLLVSAGQELNTTAAAYLDHALDRPETRVVGLFLETVRDPEPFRAALDKAAQRDVPVVVLKVGRAERARALVTAHSGALAGEDAAYEALFRAYGVLRVSSLDEMSDTLELLAAGRRAGPGGLAAVHDSGGERALLVDAAADAGVAFARISPHTTERLGAVLEDGLAPENPLDAWGTGNDYEPIFEACMQALLEDPDTAALAFCVDLTTQERAETGYVRVAKRVFERTAKPMAVLSNLSSAINRRDAASLRASGVPVLEGTLTGLGAFEHLFELRAARARPPLRDLAVIPSAVVQRWRARLATGRPWTEREALALLADYGISTVPSVAVATLEEALGAGQELGWPVALKTAAPGMAHKSAAGGVVLDISGPDELARAHSALSARLGPEAIVAAMAPPGVELALGVVRDAQFGPLVMVAAGGVLVELLEDRRWALPPVDPARAGELLDGLRVRRLLDGSPGRPPADIDALTDALARLSVLAAGLGDLIDALDVNPLVAGPAGCVAVDALVVARAREEERRRR